MENITILITHWYEYLFYGVVFYVAVFLSFTIPGSFLSRFFRLNPLVNLVVATILGMIIWVWQAIIVGTFELRHLTPLYIFVALIAWLLTKGYKQLPKLRDLKELKQYPFYLVVGICGTLMLLTPLIINGVASERGVLFCCTSDTFWYLSLTQEIIKKYPPQTPGLNGIILTNYHFFYNATIAELVRVFHLPLVPTIFQFSRILFVILYTISGLMLIRKLSRNTLVHKIFFFLLFFGSDFAHVVGFVLTGKMVIDYTSIYLSQMAFFNMPMGIATILLFITLYLLLQTKKVSGYIQYLIIGVLAGTILGFKTHMGIIVIFGIFIYAVVECISRKSLKPLSLLLSTTLVGSLIFIPTNSGSGGLYPSWFFQIEQGMQTPFLNFDLNKLEYISYWTKKGRLFTLPVIQIVQILMYELYFALIYILGFFGTTLVGILQLRRPLKGISFHLMILGMTLLATTLGMFFLQTTGVGHTYNFLIVAYILGLIYSSIVMGNWIKHTKRLYIVIPIVALMLLTNIARTTQSLITYTKTVANENIFVLSHKELEALTFLSKLPDKNSYVLVDPANFLNYVTPYISVFIDHPLYYSGEYIVSALNLNYQTRKNIANFIKTSNNPQEIINIMQKENIGYIYVKKPDVWEEYRGGIRVFIRVFSNEIIDIYSLNTIDN